MTDKNQKRTLCLVAWVGFAICVKIFLNFAFLNGRAYWNGGIIMLLAVSQLLLALYYTKTVRKTERILIEDTSVYEEAELLAGILLLPKNNLPLYDAFRKRMIDNLVQRIILNPYCLGTASKVELLLSQGGSIWSSRISVIFEGIKIEELTREQIVNLLQRSGGGMFNLSDKVPQKFRTALLQELLRQEKEGKCRLTTDDLAVLEKLKNGFISSDLQCLELRLEVGVKKETAKGVAEKVERFNQIALGRAEGPFTPGPPPVATSAC